MSQRPRWWHTLQEARRQALIAVDFYNRPGEKLSYPDFVIHMHLAWQSLAHASFERSNTNIFFRESNGRYKRDKHGNKLSWDLSTCIKRLYSATDPVYVNLEFFVGLRNTIEHRFQRSVLVATAPHAHALVLNFERELTDWFGHEYSLAEELRFPIFVQSLTPAGITEMRELRKGMPSAAKNYITEFEATLPTGVAGNPRYEYRVQLIPLKGSRTEADMAFNFVNTNALTPEQIKELAAGSKVGTVLVAEKYKSIGLMEELLPAAAVAAVGDQIPFEFNISQFTRLRWAHGIGPAQGVQADGSDGVFCIYSRPHKNHLYTRAYVARCVGELSTREGFIARLGKEPVSKV